MGIEEVMVWIWLGVFVISIVIEALEPGLISIWFAGGAILALILSIIPGVPFGLKLLFLLLLQLL
ncbi:MAG: hypothetical protein RBR94_02485 [Bacilli bacterium]|jgi:membrane protein implicated in regulation of membrane protease activity|nr:hypothetical protein [Bacilli bacterium]